MWGGVHRSSVLPLGYRIKNWSDEVSTSRVSRQSTGSELWCCRSCEALSGKMKSVLGESDSSLYRCVCVSRSSQVSLHNPFTPSRSAYPTFNTQHISPLHHFSLHNGLHKTSQRGSNLREVRLPTALSRGRPPHAQHDAQLIAQLCPSVR